jgi:hypothetical protein
MYPRQVEENRRLMKFITEYVLFCVWITGVICPKNLEGEETHFAPIANILIVFLTDWNSVVFNIVCFHSFVQMFIIYLDN